MILVIDICKEPLHKLEFVKPIEDILKNNGFKFETKHYSNLKDPEKYNRIIICGTSLRDNDFLKNIDKFEWIKAFKKPVLGICGGAHILGLLLGHKKKKNKEIGMKRLELNKEFLGSRGELGVYHLHQLQVLPEIFHQRNLYATLFHPEVRNKEMIVNFCKL